MEKLVLALVGSMLVMLFLAAGCSKEVEVNAYLNQQVRLPVGKTAIITNEDLSIKFEQVTDDSRCPAGATCVWAGEAKCQTMVTLKGVSSPLVLTVSGSSESPTVFEGYTFTINLEPYPQAGLTIDKTNYVMVLKVTK